MTRNATFAAVVVLLVALGALAYCRPRVTPVVTVEPTPTIRVVTVLPTLAATPETPGYARPDAGTRVPTPTVSPIPELILLPAATSSPTFTPVPALVLPADTPTPRPRMIQKGGLVWTPG